MEFVVDVGIRCWEAREEGSEASEHATWKCLDFEGTSNEMQ
jgi:hypothetical protein